MNEKQKKAIGVGAVALAAIAFLSPPQAEDMPQGFTGGFPVSGGVGGGGVTREGPSLAEQLQNVFQPPQFPYAPVADRAPAFAKKNETLTETVKRIGSSPVPPEAIEFGGEEQLKQLSGYQEDLAPSQSFLEKFLGIGFTPSPRGSTSQKQVGTYTPGPTPVSYPGELKSPGVSYGGSIIGGIGQSTIPTKYRSGSSSSRKSSTPSHGPIRYDTPKTAPKNLEGVITGVISTPSKNNRKTKKGLSIRKTTAAEKAKYESQRQKRLKIR